MKQTKSYNKTNRSKTGSYYRAVLQSRPTGFDGEYIVYSTQLMKGKKKICDIEGTRIIDKCEGLVKVLLEHQPARPVQVDITGIAYGRGNELFAAIVDLYNGN